jgi:hypothetical protein
MHRHTQWEDLIGALVEVHQHGQVVRSGIVDEAMPDGSAIWITSDSSQPRRIYEKSEGFLIYVEPQPLTGASTYRMTAEHLHLYAGKASPLRPQWNR